VDFGYHHTANFDPALEAERNAVKTSELIEFFKTQPFTDDQGYNLLIGDLYEFVPVEQVADAQRLVSYFMYKIQAVCFPAIRGTKGTTP
jgi:hypothetical protein